MRFPLLAPWPRQVEVLPGALTLTSGFDLRVSTGLAPLTAALARLETLLSPMGVRLGEDSSRGPSLIVERDHDLDQAQAYRLDIADSGIHIAASDSAGAFYGLQTLSQWLAVQSPEDRKGGRVGHLRVWDWPTFAHRGVLLDVSRSRVPTMDTLFELVDLLSSWKLNQLQLYTEHTFAYRGHEDVWAGSSPLTTAEIQALDAYCIERHIELVPNQNSFGHMHRWLAHPAYRPLAECPDGLEHPFSSGVEPFSLCPTDPAALTLLSDLYDQLLPCFSSRQFHVGLDETFDLGRGRSAERVEQVGVGRVYLEFLLDVHRLVRERGHRMQFWGDIIDEHPELIDEIPDDAAVTVWGYEAGHSFADQIAPLAGRGLDVYACPGTSSWLSFAGRIDNAIANIATAVRDGREGGASGCLVTDWGDRGHLQPLPISFPGFLAAACMTWNDADADRPESLPLERLLAAHALAQEPPAVPGALFDLGNLYRSTGARTFNASPLFYLVISPDLSLSHTRLEGLDEEKLVQCGDLLATTRSTLEGADRSVAARELDWVAEALAIGVDLGLARLRSGANSASDLAAHDRGQFDDRFKALIERHATLWTERSRPGGQEESRSVLEEARKSLQQD